MSEHDQFLAPMAKRIMGKPVSKINVSRATTIIGLDFIDKATQQRLSTRSVIVHKLASIPKDATGSQNTYLFC